MSVWKVLRAVYSVFLLGVVAVAIFWGYPIYRYLRNPVSALTQAESPSASAPADPGRSMDPRSLFGVNPAMIPKFETIVGRLAPHSAEARVGLGILYQYKGLLTEAARCYQKAIELDPNQPDAHYRLGTVYQSRNRLDEAAAEYEATMRARSD